MRVPERKASAKPGVDGYDEPAPRRELPRVLVSLASVEPRPVEWLRERVQHRGGAAVTSNAAPAAAG